MPETSLGKNNNKMQEEEIVQRIVEILNEKGYEYERDVRPIICWKYGVNSSRELKYDQKMIVKNALEDGTFEQWGIEYRKAVLNQDVDILKQIDDLKDEPSPIQTNVEKPNKSTEKSTATAKQDKSKKPSKIALNLKSADKADEESKQTPALKSDASDSNKIKIADSKPLDANADTVPEESVDEQLDKKLLDASGMKLEAIKKSDSSPKTPRAVFKPKEPAQEPAEATSTPVSEMPEPALSESLAAQPVSEESDQVQAAASLRKKDHLVSQDNTGVAGMDYDEARELVKQKYQKSSKESVSVVSVIVLFAAIILFGVSLYINYLLISQSELPGWLEYVCNFLK